MKMAVKIGHASIDENGKITGKKQGDQTGKEICTRSWYPKSFTAYLEPLDLNMADKAATYMEEIAANDDFGYSQPNRWTGYQAIINNGRKVKGAKGDFDCSSLILSCYIFAGLSIAASGYTGNMVKILENTGKFKVHRDAAHLNSDAYAQRGGVYVNEGSHTVMSLSSGAKAPAGSGNASGASGGANNTTYRGKGIGTATAKMNMNVRSGSNKNAASIGGVNQGTSVEVLEQLSNGWLKIVWPGASCGYAYTSNASGKYYTFVANGAAGNKNLKPVVAKSLDKSLAGKYTTTAPLNMRAKPGEIKSNNIIMEIPKGAEVQNYGYYTMVSGVKWLYISYGGKTGFSSKEYLRKRG